MKIGVLGTGMVGNALATRLAGLGHEVMIAAREKGHPKTIAWAETNGANASHGSFADAARFGEMVIIAVPGTATLDAANLAGPEALAGKVVIDVTNPLVPVPDGLPVLDPALSNTTSVGEQLQAALPDAKVVKALNTVNCAVMADPSLVSGDHDIFISGNDDGAKAEVRRLLESFGWRSIIDLGDITAARGTEMAMPFWLRLWHRIGTTAFNYKIVVKEPTP
ncbi:NADPH-dependent F420 reductase [Pelagibacterium halotolerans]|uniref:NADPH-dependent F420 reductase n=1 Tax=Pelagibacterium halotolerans TaxID=531813 RepID=UPI00384E3B59